MEKMNYQKPDTKTVRLKYENLLQTKSPNDPNGGSDSQNSNNPSRALSAPGWSDNE